ncbi:MAG: NAD(P)H-binding protein [Anaerolineaceae bacterium]|nr:NAD(P)H-binding protein [Anaerolineaceae bacterium]
MILVTGGTGFIGRILVNHLVTLGYPVRLLLNPSRDYPKLPRGVSVEVAISSMSDERNLRASMKDIDTVFHLVGTEWKGIHAEYEEVDIRAARMFSDVARQMNVQRFIYMSHIGADKSSAYNLLRAKALAEASIRESGVPYTIVRSGIVYGQNDHFTSALRDFILKTRGPLLIPGGDQTLIQPIWVEDLITTLMLCMDDNATLNQTIYTAGIETFTFREVLELVMQTIHKKKRIVPIQSSILRQIYIANEQWFPKRIPMYFWLDYMAEDRITALDILPREFGLMPTRMTQNIDYLREK